MPLPGTTDDLAEGSSHLYFTSGRASSAAPVQSVAGRTGNITFTSSDINHVGGTATNSTRTVQSKLRDIADMRDWSASIDFTGANDSTSALQNMFNEVAASGAALQMHPSCEVTSVSPIVIPRFFRMAPRGDIPVRMSGITNGKPALNTGMTVFHFAHNNVGFMRSGDDGPCLLQNFMTRRDQPSAQNGWQPLNCSWDILANATSDMTVRDVMLLNPTLGICQTSGGSAGGGRLNLENIYMDALLEGVRLDCSYDTNTLNKVRIYPYWTSSEIIAAYKRSNTTGFTVGRCDNMIAFNLFALGVRTGIRYYQWPGGSSGSAAPGGPSYGNRFIGVDIDQTATGILFHSTTNGAHVSMNAVKIQGADNADTPAIPLVDMQGNNCSLFIGNGELSLARGNAVQVSGSNNKTFGALTKLSNWDMAALGNAALSCSSSNRIDYQIFEIDNATSGAPLQSGSGKVIHGKKQNYLPAVTPAAGAFNSVVNSATYLRQSRGTSTRVRCEVDFTIVDKNTAVGTYINISLPTTASSDNLSSGLGKEINVIQKALIANVDQNATSASASVCDSTAILVNGCHGHITFEYDEA